jgi:SAM-dependent methyltransferase
MTLLLSPPQHPYLREIKFVEADLAAFDRHPCCPACRSTSAAVALVEFGQASWTHRVQLVQCPDCDHVYYLNPPSAEYFARFYREEWNRGRETLEAPVKPSRKVKHTMAALLGDLGQRDPATPVLEIGCGLGAMLAGLEAAGYRDLYGTEASTYRAAASAARFPGRVFAGGYDGVPDGLTFGVIYSNHVFEHIYDPSDALGWAVGRLRPGGIVAITVPSAWGEPVINQLLFLPHLHSFCHRSLVAMGRSHGLDCIFWSGANQPYEVTAVFFRLGETPAFAPARFVRAADAPEAAPRRQTERIAGPLHRASRRRTVHFALHADEADSVRMASEGGVRQVGAPARLVARLAGPIAKALAALGLRKLGNKRLGRIRFVSGRFDGADDAVPLIGSDDGKLVFHIK